MGEKLQQEFLFLYLHPVTISDDAWKTYKHFVKVRDNEGQQFIYDPRCDGNPDNGDPRTLLHGEDGPAFKDSYFLFGRQLKDIRLAGASMSKESIVYLRLAGLM